ncbi:hypothetical protein N7481_001344 [Penicillium waksmanii]|uniref:uncharacterized protein n=1 Tax=Penicillium waksmanii TaxID=69791 RepID=UPI002546CE8D|nr:uncharacterized protein N7481_001344 [Penicillium waksmanii]KAJ6000935.1 hypothetical protein N7481_001344 [Penicillium waksmanii]
MACSSDENSENLSQSDRHQVHDFISRRKDKELSVLSLADTPLSAFSTKLDDYLSVLHGAGSIAFGRGEELTSVRLSKSVERLFSTAVPFIKEGTPLSWTAIILFAGPQFEGSSQFSVGGSKVELSVHDLELLRSGRPWRFLSPWPDRNDYKKELQSCEVTLHELDDTRREVNEVLEKVSLVEQYLRNHRDKVTQSSQDQLLNSNPGNSPGLDITQGPVLCQSLTKDLQDQPVCDQRPLRVPTDLHCPNSDQKRPPFNGASCDQPSIGNNLAGNGTPRSITPSANGAGEGNRLHDSDFIQSLSELCGTKLLKTLCSQLTCTSILDEPANEEAMRWSEDGRSVWIAQESEIPPNILDQLSAKSYQSFIRRLYYHGFHKSGAVYHHDLFIRGQPSSIQPPRRVSYGLSASLPLPNSTPMHGPRYKIIKKRRRPNERA